MRVFVQMRFSLTLIESGEVSKEYLSVLYPEACAVPLEADGTAVCGQQTWVWRRHESPWAPPLHDEGAPVAVGVWGGVWGGVLKQSGTPRSPLAPCSSPPGLAQGGGSLGEARQSPGSQPGLCLPAGSSAVRRNFVFSPVAGNPLLLMGPLVGAVIQMPKRFLTPKVLNCENSHLFSFRHPLETEI